MVVVFFLKCGHADSITSKLSRLKNQFYSQVEAAAQTKAKQSDALEAVCGYADTHSLVLQSCRRRLLKSHGKPPEWSNLWEAMIISPADKQAGKTTCQPQNEWAAFSRHWVLSSIQEGGNVGDEGIHGFANPCTQVLQRIFDPAVLVFQGLHNPSPKCLIRASSKLSAENNDCWI